MDKITIINGEQVKEEHVLAALELDYQYYPKQYHISKETCLGYFNSNKNIYNILLQNGKVAGYLNFCPIDKKSYEKILSGKCTDMCLKPKNILDYCDNTTYYGYFSSIVIKKELRHKGYGTMLLQSLISQLVEFSKRGIYFEKILADVISDAGMGQIIKFGFSSLKESNNNSTIFEATLIPNKLNRTQYNEPLFEVYK